MRSTEKIIIIIYIIVIAFSIMTESSVGAKLVDTNGKIFMFGLIMTILEIPLIYYVVWKMILEKIADEISYVENDKNICSFFSFIALPIIFTALNMIIIETLNESMDKSKPIKRYLAVTKKYYEVMSRSKDNPRTNRHYINLTSWLSNNKFTVRISHQEYENTAVNDVYEVITKSGCFGFGYYNSIHKIDKSIFPDGTKFPIDENQAQKLIVEKNNN